ncbi:MAG TPA: sialidase family protein [Gaiellaceae bacterium]|nr:sialidase family protein [Gaiellaceae bacterium]
MRNRKWIVTAGVLALIVMGAGLTGAALRRADRGRDITSPDSAVVREAEGEGEFDAEWEDGYFDPRKEAKFERTGGEADRKGPDTPAAEQVENRAFPRSYVNDKRAVAEHKKFTNTPKKPDRSAFKNTAAFNEALSAAPGAWTALGPVTGDVPGESGQFFDLETQTGPSTQESGRVTALAIDPNCGKASAPSGAPCRLWVAAAGGGIWRTNNALAAQPTWIAPPDDLPTNSFGSLIVDPNDASGDTLYAGSGEPNGSGDSEAGLGLFRSTNGGQTWQLVSGSASVATNRSIGAVAIRPGHPDTIVIGTAVARHGSSSVNGGRFTPPNAPTLGFYSSTDGGAHFTLSTDLQGKTPPNPAPSSSGVDWFQGGITKIEYDPNSNSTVYAGVLGYGVWRSTDGGAHWSQVFQTMNPADFFGDRTEFDAVKLAGGKTRIYLGDSSDDLLVARVYRTDDAAAITGSATGGYSNAGWTELSSSQNGTNGFLAYYYCQNGQCGYDDFVVSPASQPGVSAGREGELWLGGSMNYDELPAYAGLPPRSNGRAVIRSTNAGASAADVTWGDMTATLGPAPEYAFTKGIHPDQHAVVFDSADPRIAFVGSDGGVVRIDMRSPVDASAACSSRRFGGEPLAADDLADCQRVLNGIPSSIEPINSGLNTIQFQSLSVNPANQTGDLLGGTQDNGTFSYTGGPTWLESVGGDGGQSGFDVTNPTTRYHNYYDATPEVNFHGTDPKEWLAIYDPLQASKEARSFYVPFQADPSVGGRAFIGLEHVWRTDDHGGDPEFLEEHCNALHRDAGPCGDWQPLGNSLTIGSARDRGGQFVVAVVPSPSDNGTLWAGTRAGRIWVSKDADSANPRNAHFWRIDTAATPGRFVSGIAIDPQDSNHAWISYSGYGAYTPGTPQHVLEARFDPKSHTGTFVDRSYDIGDQPITGLARNDDNGDLYAATDFGVLRLAAGATQWVRAGTGLPTASVFGLTLAQDANVLYAATHGRGAYSISLP